MEGTPPRFFATDAYNFVPGVSSFMKMFKTIPVESRAIKDNTGRSANAGTLELASKALKEKGCVALFPQGNFARIGQDAPRVYTGAAQLALKNKIAIHVIRLDGFWSLQNPLIPMFIRNSAAYRAFLSAFHVNNVRTTLCCVIDFHLQPENQHLGEKEIIDEICAQLYAYYRHTQELTGEQIDTIKDEIKNKTHLEIWHNKVKQDELGKQLITLKKEEAKLEEPTTKAMRLL
jgi:1-acyl-sn-glycerol-3-phosphate acyltransferase